MTAPTSGKSAHTTPTKALANTCAKSDSPDADAQSPDTFAVNPSVLFALRDTLALCAFAAEANRVLGDLDLACQIYPALEPILAKRIEARHEWQNMDLPLAAVLSRAALQLDLMLEAV
jgi:hypothetical protein